ncbi:MAG: cytochrome-c peroxidase [Saprospiraceae bacterium]
MNKFILGTIILIIAISACTSDKVQLATQNDILLENAIKKFSPDGELEHFVLPQSNDYNSIPTSPENPITPVKVALGKFLFFETGLGLAPMQDVGEGTYSCGSCHIPSAGFKSGREQGIGEGGVGFGINGEARTMSDLYTPEQLDAQGARPLSMLNAAYVTNALWNGQFGGGGVNEGTEAVWNDDNGSSINHLGYGGLESQNIESLHLHRMVINKDVVTDLGYLPYFESAFSDFPEDERYSDVTASFAIAAYLRTLITNKAPFQDYLKGNRNALTEQEKRGAMLFFGDAKCATCHSSPSLNSMTFYAVGVKDLYQCGTNVFNTSIDDTRNLGRGSFTGNPEDMHKFKVPQLYNLKDTPFYFHGSSKTTLREVVEYFNDAIPENVNVPASQIPPIFSPLGMSESDIDDLVSFLENGLHDPDLERYAPDYILSGNCFPNNDPQSRIDLGCD